MKNQKVISGTILAIIVGIAIWLNSTQTSITPRLLPKPTPRPTVTIGNVVVGVDLADTDETRAKGLGGRQILGDNEGMLFDFGASDIQPIFWMKGMSIPIDIIWINDGEVSQIHENVQPPDFGTPDESLERFIPDDPIDLVLEVKAGFAVENEIDVGSKVSIPQPL